MSVKICQHVKVDGTLCQVPPLNGRHYCHFHLESLGRRIRMARSRARREQYHLVLPILEDLNSVEVARQHVMDALGAGLIPHKVAGQLLFGLQGIASDLHSAHPPRLGVYDPAIDTAPRATDHPNFEEKFDLPPDLDLSQPPEVVFAAEAVQNAITKAEPSPYRSELFRHDHIAPEDVELEEILKKEGEDAYRKRERELNRQAMQKISDRRREVKRAQYIVEADRRNTDIICGSPEERARVKAEIEKERAEAAAKRRAEMEAALRASGQIPPTTGSDAAGADVASRQPFSSVSADGMVGMGHLPPEENGDLGKKPSATASGEGAAIAPATGTDKSEK